MKDFTSYRIRGKMRELVMLLGMSLLFSFSAFSQANIAPLATITGDGTGGGGCRPVGAVPPGCGSLNDLNLGTCGTQQMWISTATPPSTTPGDDYIEWQFPTPRTFDTLVIHHAQTTGRFLTGALVQYWDGTAWVNHTTFSGLPQQCVNRVGIGKLTTDRFRITQWVAGTGQASNMNFREIEIIEAPTGLNDASVMAVDSPTVYCAGTHNVIVTVGNYGINQIDSVDIEWEVNGVAQPTVQYIGLLDTINGSFPFSAQVTLGSQTFAAGPTQIKAWTTNPNGGVDTVNVNDTINVTVTSAAAPTAVTAYNPTLNSITVDAVGGAGTIDYEYGPTGFVQGNGTSGSSPTPTFTITGLNQGTVYDVYVRSNCGSSDVSAWVGPETFFTSFGIPFIQDFENFTAGITGNPWPEGWSSTTTTDPNWESEDATGANENSAATGPLYDHTIFGQSGGMYMYMETSGGTVGDSADFVSPPIYIDSTLTTVELSYWYFNHGTNVDRMQVIVDTNGIENVVATYTGQQQANQTDPWLQGAHFLTGYQGKSVVIKFRGFNPPCCSGDLAIDDVRIDPVLPLNAGVLELQSPSGSLCPGSITPVVGVKNFGSNVLDSVTVVWDVNGVLDSAKYIGQILPGDTASVSLATLNITASQVYNLKFYTSQPNGQNDQFAADDTLEINGMQTGLSGTVTVDATQPASATNFQNFASLTQVLNNYGVCGPTTVNVAVGVYNEPIYLENIPGSSAINHLLISGTDSSQTIVRHDASQRFATLTFDNVEHVAVKNMTIENTSTTGDAVIFSGNSRYDTLSNCVTKVSTSSTSPYNISISSNASGNSTGAQSDYIVIQNNRLIGGYYAIWSYGSTTDLVTSVEVLNNYVDSAYYAGIYGFYNDSLEVIGNEVYQNNRGYAFAYGIMIYYTNNTQILKNYSHASYAAGYFYNFNTYAPANRRYEITNNMFISDGQYGVYMYYVDSVNMFHNSINNLGAGQGIFIGGSTSPIITSYDVRNNIFNAASGVALEVNEPDTIFDKFNNNLYNTGGGTLLNIDGVTYTDLASYQLAQPLLNTASLEGDPQFLSNTDLHIIGAFVNDNGDNSVNVVDDIDGDVRPMPGATIVDIGADEFDPPTCPPPFNMGAFNPSLDSVTIFWTGNFGASTYEYEIVPCGSGQGSGTTVVTGLDSLRIGGLTPSTCYELYLREVCGRGDTSFWVGPTSFNTANGIPYFEDFETFTAGIFSNPWPNGWSSTTTTDPNWESETGTGANANSVGTGPLYDHTQFGVSGGIYMYMETSGGTVGDSADFVSAPIFVSPNMNVVELSYWYFFHGGNIDGMDVIVESNGIESVVSSIRGQQQPNQTDPWIKDSVSLVGYAGQSIQVKFRGYNVACCDGDIAIDDVRLDVVAPIDGAIMALDEPVNDSLQCYTATENVSVELFNAGSQALDFTVDTADVTVNVSGATTQNLSFTVNDNTLNGGVALGSGQSISVPMGTIDMTAVGAYYFDATVSISADGVATNNNYQDTIVTLAQSGGSLAMNDDSLCLGDSATLVVDGSYGSIQWQVYDSTAGWQNIASATNPSIDVNPTVNTAYRVLACGSATSDTLTLNIVSLQAPTVINNTTIVSCDSSGTDTLIATYPAAGIGFSWYDAATGGNLIQSGDTLLFTGTPSAGTPVRDTFYVSASTGGGGSDTALPVPHQSVYSGNVRGYHFVAPMDFTITGLEVPIDAGTGNQSVAVLKTDNNVPWNLWNAAIVPFTTLYLNQNSTIGGYIPVNIPIKAGDVIGILGQRGTGNSYSNATSIDINGVTVPIQRFIMQNQLGTTAPASATNLGYEASTNIARVNFTYSTGCEGPRAMVIGEVDCVVGIEDAESLANNFEVYPNPSNGLFTLNISTEKAERYHLSVRDVQGKLIYEEEISVNGAYREELDLKGLAKGVYYLQVQNDEASEVKKLIIQ